MKRLFTFDIRVFFAGVLLGLGVVMLSPTVASADPGGPPCEEDCGE